VEAYAKELSELTGEIWTSNRAFVDALRNWCACVSCTVACAVARSTTAGVERHRTALRGRFQTHMSPEAPCGPPGSRWLDLFS
jgi:hypothetical protein